LGDVKAAGASKPAISSARTAAWSSWCNWMNSGRMAAAGKGDKDTVESGIQGL
jgi:hypothetical protein